MVLNIDEADQPHYNNNYEAMHELSNSFNFNFNH